MHSLFTSKYFSYFVFFFGCLVGLLCHLSIQDGLYNSQIVAHVIDYKPSDLMYIWGINLWSIMSQITGLALFVGVSEFTLSIILSITLNGLSFLALYLILRSITHNQFISFLAVIVTYLSQHYLFGLSYEVSMSSWAFFNSTWGTYGFHFSLLAIGLFLTNHHRSSFFLCGLLFSIHFFLGSFIVFTLFMSILLNKDKMKEYFNDSKFFLFGISITLLSYFINYLQYGDIESSIPKESLTNFISGWDSHRDVSFDFFRSTVFVNLFAMIASITFYFRKKIRESKILNWILVTSISCFIIFLFYFTGLLNYFAFLHVALPDRMFNFLYFLSLPVVAAMLYQRTIIPFSIFVCSVFLDFYIPIFINDFVTIYVLILLLLSGCFEFKANFSYHRHVKYFILFICIIFIGSKVNFQQRYSRLTEFFNSELSQYLSKQKGMLLVSPLHISSKVQLYSRRPILMDTTELSEISYAFHTYSKANHIMKDIFKVELNENYKSLFIDYDGTETIEPNYVKQIWEKRSVEEWKNLSQVHGFNGVLAPLSWKINLETEFSNSSDKLLKIP